jgi:hypothetical protein
VAIDLLGQGDGPVPAVGRKARFRTISHWIVKPAFWLRQCHEYLSGTRARRALACAATCSTFSTPSCAGTSRSFPGACRRSLLPTDGRITTADLGIGFRATPTMAGSSAVRRRELWPAGVHDPNSSGHAKDQLLTAIRAGTEVSVAWQKFPENGSHVFPFF